MRASPKNHLQVWPRDFANEFSIYSVNLDCAEEVRAAKNYPASLERGSHEWISADTAKRRLSTALRNAKSHAGDRHFGSSEVQCFALLQEEVGHEH